METIFLNTEKRKTNESDKFSYYFSDKLNLKHANENIALVNLSIGKTLNLHITTINVTHLL